VPLNASRRDFLAASSAALAALCLATDVEKVRASLRHAAHAARSPTPADWEAFTPEQAADVEAIASQIFPTDETPGAKEAHVVNFIDHGLATWAAPQREVLIKGLDELNRRGKKRFKGTPRFASLTSDQQNALLKEREKTPFFTQMRLLTLVGMFSLPSYGGNTDRVGWQLIGFDDRFVWQPPFGDYDAEAARTGG